MLVRASVRLWLLTLSASLPICLALAGPPTAAEKNPDLAVQGEYLGEVSKPGAKQTLGVQVVAKGNGKFQAFAFNGGLPGDGWDMNDALACDGETVKGVTTLANGDFSAQIKDGAMTVKTARGLAGKLTKIARRSPTLDAKPPQGAIVLFDGKSADQFEGGRVTEDGLLRPGATSKLKFQSGALHVEFQIPYAPLIASRGNSGVYLQSRYEVQILDSIGFKPHNHECGGIPSVREPDLTMSFPPLAWQTYDVEFTAATFQNGKKGKPARMTVRHNGVLIHNDVEVPHATTSSPLPEGPEAGPLNLQEHGSEVRFRNIWFVPHSD